MTEEEWMFAKKHNYLGIEDFDEIIDEFGELEEDNHSVMVSSSDKVSGAYVQLKENSDRIRQNQRATPERS